MISKLFGYDNFVDLAFAAYARITHSLTTADKEVLRRFRDLNFGAVHKISERQIVALLPEVGRGDFRHLEKKPHLITWATWLHAWSPLVASRSVEGANCGLCAPLLRAVCEEGPDGRGAALSEYRRLRLLSGSTFPDWIKTHLYEEQLALSEAIRTGPPEVRRSTLEEKRDLFLCLSPIAIFPEKFVSEGLGEEHSIDFEKELLARVYKEGWNRNTIARTEFGMGKSNTRFSNHQALAGRLLTLRLFADLAEVYRIPEPERNLEWFLSQTSSIEELLNTQRFRKLIVSAKACDEFPAAIKFFGTLLISKHPKTIAQRIETSGRAVLVPAPLRDKSEPAESRIYSTPDASADLLLGIRQSLQSFHPDLEDAPRVARQLNALIRRGLMTFEEIIAGLTNNDSPASLIITGRQRSGVAGVDTQNIKGSSSAGSQATEESSEVSRECSVFFASAAVLKELDNIEGSMLRLTLQRLARLALGEVLDHSTIQGDIKQLKIHHGSGVRIFYNELSDGSYVILGIAIKAEQQDEIDRLRKQGGSLEPRNFIRYL